MLRKSMALQLSPHPSAKPVEDFKGGPMVPQMLNARTICLRALAQARTIGLGRPRCTPMANNGSLGGGYML